MIEVEPLEPYSTQYTFVLSIDIDEGLGRPAARVTGAPPVRESFITAPSAAHGGHAAPLPPFTQYTLVESTAMATGLSWFDASTTGKHAPFEHPPPWQSCSHAPQFAGSTRTSVHSPAQTVWAAGQPHVPAMHIAPCAHARPHAPQLLGSVDVLVQPGAPPSEAQGSWPGTQLAVHIPEEHAADGVHRWPQDPQLSGSDVVVAQ